MSNYNKIRTLDQLVSTDPADTEDASKLAAADRQLRDLLKTFLGVSFNNDGTFKAGSVSAGSILANQSVAGTTANSAGTAQQIAQGTISTPDFRAGAVDSNALAANSVVTAKIPDNAVITAKIPDGAVTAAKIAASTITSTQVATGGINNGNLASDAVTTVKIADANVTGAKIAATTVTTGNLASQTSGTVLCGTGSGVAAATVGGVLLATYSAGVLSFSLASGGVSGIANYAKVVRTFASGTSGGAATGGQYDTLNTGWSLEQGTAVSIASQKIHFGIAGTYLVRFAAYAYSVGAHRVKVVQSGTPDVDLLFGTVAYAQAGNQTPSLVEGLINISTAGTDIIIKHWAQNAKATNGFGCPVTIASEAEVYVVGEVLRVA